MRVVELGSKSGSGLGFERCLALSGLLGGPCGYLVRLRLLLIHLRSHLSTMGQALGFMLQFSSVSVRKG